MDYHIEISSIVKNKKSKKSLMVGDKLILTSFTADELVDLFRPMIKDIILSVVGEREEKLLSPAQTCLLFEPKISKTTLSTLTKQGLINEHRIGRNVYYKQSEILEKSKVLRRYKN